MKSPFASFLVLVLVSMAAALAGCEDKVELSKVRAGEHVRHLAELVEADVGEVRRGLPEGAALLSRLWTDEGGPEDDLPAVREGLETARNKVQELRIAKSTFFAVADDRGIVLRNDQEQDRMAGKALFASYPGLKSALGGRYVETVGAMAEARGVDESREDGQWVAAAPIRVGDVTRGLYVTGWSWAAYAYRLEFALRSLVRSELARQERRRENEPLIYVFLIQGGRAYGAPVTPEVSLRAIEELAPIEKVDGDAPFTGTIEITGRRFGIAAQRTPALGEDAGVAVVRSET